jgi:superoxide reductase
MTKLNQVYRCEVCGNIVEVVHPGVGQLVCCKQPMAYMEEGTIDAAVEKHVPVIEKTDGGILVKVGEVAHPMGEDHYIEWIELVADSVVYRTYLKPGDAPEALFPIQSGDYTARAYCNLHGNWKS